MSDECPAVVQEELQQDLTIRGFDYDESRIMVVPAAMPHTDPGK
jgi:hypothetical protein